MKAVVVPLLAAAALIAPTPARAQFRVGGFGASTLTWFALERPGRLGPPGLQGGESSWFDGRAGRAAGLVLGWQASPRLALELQPTFVTKGDEPWDMACVPCTVRPPHAATRLSYFELPLLLKYSLRTHGLQPYLLAGPALALRRDATRVLDGKDAADLDAHVKGTDLGLAVGAGLALPAGRLRLFAECQYTAGLANIEAAPGPGVDTRNRAVLFKLGLAVSP